MREPRLPSLPPSSSPNSYPGLAAGGGSPPSTPAISGRLLGLGAAGVGFVVAAIGLLSDGVSLSDRLLAGEPRLDMEVAYLNQTGQPYVELAEDAGRMELGKIRADQWGASLELTPLHARGEVHLLTFVQVEDAELGDRFEPVLYSQQAMDSVGWKLGISQVPSVTMVLLEADERQAREVRDLVAAQIDYVPSDVRGQVHLNPDGWLMLEPGSKGAAGPAPAPFQCAVWEHELVELLADQPGLRFAGRTMPTFVPSEPEAAR